MRVISMIDILTIPGQYGWDTQPYWRSGTKKLNWNQLNSYYYDHKLNFPKLKLWCWWHSAAKTMLRSMKNRQMIEFRVKWRTHSNQGTNDDISKNLPNHLIWRHNQWPKKLKFLAKRFHLTIAALLTKYVLSCAHSFFFEYWGICEWDRFIFFSRTFSFSIWQLPLTYRRHAIDTPPNYQPALRAHCARKGVDAPSAAPQLYSSPTDAI